MISYAPFYRTLIRKKLTENQVRILAGLSSSTMYRIQHGQGISTATLDKLCKVLHCRIGHIVEYVKDPVPTEKKTVVVVKKAKDDDPNSIWARKEPDPQPKPLHIFFT